MVRLDLLMLAGLRLQVDGAKIDVDQERYVDQELNKYLENVSNGVQDKNPFLLDLMKEHKPLNRKIDSKITKLTPEEQYFKFSSSRSISTCPDPASDSSCDFEDITESEDFEEVFVDCMNQPIPITAGRWFKPKQSFPGKDQSLYHIPDASLGLREVDYATADSYCKNLGVQNSYLWCPASTQENFYLWWHHNGQPFGKTDGPSVWTGIIRLSSSGLFNADGWKCHDLYDQNYFNWISGQPSFVNWNTFMPEWNTVLTCNTPQWDDINDSDPAAIVCEMMCDLVEDPVTTEEPTTTTEATTEDPDTCPIKQMTGTHNVTINTNTGLHDSLSNIVCEDTVTQIINHGCHCIAIDQFGFVVDYTGGSVKMDVVDENCKYWREARKCVTLPGGHCEGVFLKDTSYIVEVNYDLELFDCNKISDPCFKDLCLIDSHFAAQIATLEDIAANNFTEILGDVFKCPKKKGKGATSCTGEAPHVVLLKD